MSIGRRGSCEGPREICNFILFFILAGLSSEAMFLLVRGHEGYSTLPGLPRGASAYFTNYDTLRTLRNSPPRWLTLEYLNFKP